MRRAATDRLIQYAKTLLKSWIVWLGAAIIILPPAILLINLRLMQWGIIEDDRIHIMPNAITMVASLAWVLGFWPGLILVAVGLIKSWMAVYHNALRP